MDKRMKLILAKTIYYGAIGLLGLASIASVGLMLWFLSELIGPTGWLIIGLLTALSLIAFGLGQAYWWADRYLKEHKK